MLYNNFSLKYKSCGKMPAFSLVEVLMTLFIITIILVVVSPVITKKILPKKYEGVVYTYNGTNTTEENKCFVYIKAKKSYFPTKDCSEYIFTVPEGVNEVNLTLVAGGGGGGGAGGGVLYPSTHKTELKATGTSSYTFGGLVWDKLRSIKINYFTAPGATGYKVNEDYTQKIFDQATKDGVLISHGRGGASSAAIYNYEIPQELTKYEYKTPFIREDTMHLEAHIQTQKEDSGDNTNFSNKASRPYAIIKFLNQDSTNPANMNVQYGVVPAWAYYNKLEPHEDTTTWYSINPDELKVIREDNIICCKNGSIEFNKGMLECTDGERCEQYIPKENRYDSVLGNLRGYWLHKSVAVFRPNKNYGYIEGDAGGKLPKYPQYGAGGKGQAVVCSAGSSGDASTELHKSTAYKEFKAFIGSSTDTNHLPHLNMTCKPDGKPQAGSPGIISTTFTYELPGGVGSGGAGGGVLKINNLHVTSGETYVIRVGKGGAGGFAGKYGFHNDYDTNDKKALLDGTDGISGVSTSIWQKSGNSETLLYIVTGGTGGNAGKAVRKGSSTNWLQNYAKDENRNAINGAAVEYIPSYNTYNNPRGTLDTDIVEESAYISALMNLGNKAKYLYYPIFRDNEKPYGYLNSNISNNKTVADINNSYKYEANSSSSTAKLRSFSNFVDNSNGQQVPYNNIFTGFYYRTLVGNDVGYVGGLGGFTGLGTKAGCGGLFMGNPNGFNGDKTNPKYDSKYTKVFEHQYKLNSDEYSYKNISDYYDKCTTSTADGQSAEFILPDPKKQSYGQAGAGGGGGGYIMRKGAGNGGSGQNGYLMIDWRK